MKAISLTLLLFVGTAFGGNTPASSGHNSSSLRVVNDWIPVIAHGSEETNQKNYPSIHEIDRKLLNISYTATKYHVWENNPTRYLEHGITYTLGPNEYWHKMNMINRRNHPHAIGNSYSPLECDFVPGGKVEFIEKTNNDLALLKYIPPKNQDDIYTYQSNSPCLNNGALDTKFFFLPMKDVPFSRDIASDKQDKKNSLFGRIGRFLSFSGR